MDCGYIYPERIFTWLTAEIFPLHSTHSVGVNGLITLLLSLKQEHGAVVDLLQRRIDTLFHQH